MSATLQHAPPCRPWYDGSKAWRSGIVRRLSDWQPGRQSPTGAQRGVCEGGGDGLAAVVPAQLARSAGGRRSATACAGSVCAGRSLRPLPALPACPVVGPSLDPTTPTGSVDGTRRPSLSLGAPQSDAAAGGLADGGTHAGHRAARADARASPSDMACGRGPARGGIGRSARVPVHHSPRILACPVSSGDSGHTGHSGSNMLDRGELAAMDGPARGQDGGDLTHALSKRVWRMAGG